MSSNAPIFSRLPSRFCILRLSNNFIIPNMNLKVKLWVQSVSALQDCPIYSDFLF